MAHEFDYVVVGAGTAGAIVARRLAEDPSVSVAVLEAGCSDEGNDAVLHLRRWLELLGGPLDFDYDTISGDGRKGPFQHNRARLLGGCSSHNTAIIFRPPGYDLEAWVREGAIGWDLHSCTAALDRIEEKMHVEHGPRPDPLSRDFIRAAVEAGYPGISFARDGVRQGAGWLDLAVKGEIRQSSSVCYLHPLSALPDNLSIFLETSAHKITLADGRARSVLTDQGEFRARREIILAAGVFDTPKLLMLSGIGPGNHLQTMGLPVHLDRPGVGTHLLDHPDVPINFETGHDKQPSTYFYADAALFLELDESQPGVDVMFHFGNPTFDMQSDELDQRAIARSFNISVEPSHAKSEGHMLLASPEPHAPPAIHVNYFSDPHDHDIQHTVQGIRVARDLVRQPAFADWAVTELSPGASNATSDEEIAAYARERAGTACHPCGTCRMGAVNNPSSVVDEKLRVYGVDGLRIADGSVFPTITAINLVMTTMMVGERCAEFLRSP